MIPEKQLLRLVNQVPQILFETDENGVWTFLTRAWEDATGYAVAESLGRPFGEFLYRGDADAAQRFFAALMAGEQETITAELRFRHRTGGFRWFEIFARARFDQSGDFCGSYGTFSDITEQRQVDEELRMYQETLEDMVELRTAELQAANVDLRESEVLFRASFENSPLGMALTGPDGRFRQVNRSLAGMLGYSREELIEKTFQEITHPEDLDTSVAYLRELLAGERDAFVDEKRYLHRDGHIVYVQLNVSARRDEQGHANLFVTQVQDITARKQAEDTLASRLRFEQALAASSQVLLGLAEEATEQALAELRQAAGVSRAYLFENYRGEDGVLYARQVAEVVAPGMAAQIDEPALAALSYEDAGLGRWREILSGGGVIAAAVAELPEAEQQHLLSRGIRSLLLLPIMVEGAWYGFMGFEDREKAGDWDEENVRLLRTAADMIGTYIAHRHLEARISQSLARRGRQVALSARLAQRIAAATDLGQLYEQVVEQVNDAFGYYYTQLLRYHPLEEAAVLAAGSGELGEKMLATGHRMPLGTGLIGTAAATGQSVLRSDVREDPAWQPNPLLPQTEGELAVPIMLGDEVLGVLDIQSDRAGALDEEDQLLVEGLSGQIASAIESTRLRQQTEERVRELNNLQRLMSREAWLQYQAGAGQNNPGFLYDRLEVQPLNQEQPTPAGDRHANGKGMVVRPLTVRGERFGMLGVKEDPDNPLAPSDVELLDAISQQVAEALENARLLEQTQKRAVELETVSRVSAATSTILDADKLLQAVVELAKRSFNLYHAHIYLLNQEGNTLELAAGSGTAGDIMVGQKWEIPLAQERSLVARAARRREGIIVNDVRADADFMPNPFLSETRAEMAVPLIVGERLLGVLDVQSDRANYFSEEDVRIQSALASQVAIALQNATLYQDQLETTEQLLEFDRLKSEFLASMSHELRTPLNSIIGFADVLLEGIDGELNERMEEDVRLIRNSGDHLRNLIGDILDMSKIEAGMMDLRYETIDLRAMGSELESFARSQMLAYDKSLDFTLDVQPGVERVIADRTRFKQVLFNLISNAVKFTTEGGIRLSMANEDGFLEVSVADSGIGIDEEHIPIVFEQFRQVDGSLTRTAGGTGLGLPISKSLVELHGGEIYVESRVGEGTTFTFTLPVAGRKSQRGT